MICPECGGTQTEIAAPAEISYGENVAPAGTGIKLTCTGTKRMCVYRCKGCGNKFISGVGISGKGVGVFVAGGK